MDSLYRPSDADFLADPYPSYARLRDESPVHRACFDQRGTPVTVVVLSRWEDCVRVLRDPRFSAEKDFELLFDTPRSDSETVRDPVVTFVAALMLFCDPPQHTRLRTLVNKAFTPRRVASLRSRVQATVDSLLEPFGTGTHIDLIRDLAAPLPVRVIAELLGVPAEDHMQLKQWSDRAAVLLDGSLRVDHQEEGIASLMEFVAYLAEVVQQRRREPKDDLVSALVAAQEADDRLSEVEVLATCLLILAAGHESTTNQIGNVMKLLVDRPDAMRRLRSAPGLIDSAVEELLRFDSPVQVTSRTPVEDVVIRGERIEAGIEVNTLFGAANRDPRQFRQPDELDLRRSENRHLAFGHGPHFCLGAMLARLEGQVAIATLLGRHPSIALAAEPKRRPGFVLRGFESLTLRL